MIKLWKVKVRIKGDRKPRITLGIEEESHELVVWKHWVRFAPEYEYLHNRNLQNNHSFMEMLLKIGNYYTVMKQEKSHLYSANIMGITQILLSVISGFHRNTITEKLRDLVDKEYISFTSSRGQSAEINIMLNEYNKLHHRVYAIEKDWLTENIIVDKVEVIGETEDGKIYKTLGSPNGINEMSDFPTLELVELHRKPTLEGIDSSDESHRKPTIQVANIVTEIPEGEQIDRNDLCLDPNQFEGETKEFVLQLQQLKLTNREVWGGRGGSNTSQDRLDKLVSINNSNDIASIGPVYLRDKLIKRTEISSLSTWEQVIAVFYERETGLELSKTDIDYIKEVLKISGPNQIISAIKSAKGWRANLPTNYHGLSDKEKKQCVVESQPGYYLKKYGMKHIFNFISNSPRFRKDRKKSTSTGVVSGLNEQKVREQQRKILEELKKKKYGDKTKDGK